MFLSKIKIAATVLLVLATLGTSAGLVTHRALADRPAPPSEISADVPDNAPLPEPAVALAEEKEKKEKTKQVQVIFSAVDAGKGTITVAVPPESKGKESTEQTFTLAKEVKVLLNDGLAKNSEDKEGALADLAAGEVLVLQFAEDGKTVASVRPQPQSVMGHIKSVNGADNSITLIVKRMKLCEQTIKLGDGVKVLLNDGLKKGTPDQEGKLANLAEGTPVNVRFSVCNKNTALAIHVLGGTVQGTVKGVDAGNLTISIEMKENGRPVAKTFTLAKDARVDGRLTDLVAGTPVALRLSVFDGKTVVAVTVFKRDDNPKGGK